MSSLEVMEARLSTSSFALHSCFVGITGRMVLKCSSLSFLAASSLIFCTLIEVLGMRPRGHQRGVGAVPGTVVLDTHLCPESTETRWFSLGNWTVWYGGRRDLILASVPVSVFTSGTLSYLAATSSGLLSV
jgi:hypothetical protein